MVSEEKVYFSNALPIIWNDVAKIVFFRKFCQNCNHFKREMFFD
ncbi:hypothetical protein SAMN03080601_01776 [Alkalitalea saponilacus]|uniref:Uncharacterized protein n=1 Tax=Alkalitalea saponilacus TaxID=889453 RepID=A0A1T5G8U0_9BACT|nr:hypothetical protein SAMN03080601_01776 [Alkalitalea saponilacus]